MILLNARSVPPQNLKSVLSWRNTELELAGMKEQDGQRKEVVNIWTLVDVGGGGGRGGGLVPGKRGAVRNQTEMGRDSLGKVKA